MTPLKVAEGEIAAFVIRIVMPLSRGVAEVIVEFHKTYTPGKFQLDPDKRWLTRDRVPVRLAYLPFQVLL
jgi:hypothetical protein